MKINIQILIALGILVLIAVVPAYAKSDSIKPGTRVLMDAHNCYPYEDWWSDRIDRALSAGIPLAIEQDLYWYTDPKTAHSWSVVAHQAPLSGHEPTLDQYFFSRVKPIVEQALRRGNHGNWPIITLNLDVKTEEPEHLQAIWKVLEEHKDWITTAIRAQDIQQVSPLDVRPILVLTGESDAQQKVFYDDVPVGGKLLVFGAVHTFTQNRISAPEVLEPEKENNYRRWWNNPWSVVEAGGQQHAGEWTAQDARRLRSLVDRAHANGLWIRFYTLDGVKKKALSCNGWFPGYNFGSKDAVERRWKAAYRAGVDYIATDEYEVLAAYLRQLEHNQVTNNVNAVKK